MAKEFMGTTYQGLMMKIDIENIKKISLQKNDVLVVKVPKEYEENIGYFKSNLMEMFPKNKCIIHMGEFDFTKITQERMENE